MFNDGFGSVLGLSEGPSREEKRCYLILLVHGSKIYLRFLKFVFVFFVFFVRYFYVLFVLFFSEVICVDFEPINCLSKHQNKWFYYGNTYILKKTRFCIGRRVWVPKGTQTGSCWGTLWGFWGS